MRKKRFRKFLQPWCIRGIVVFTYFIIPPLCKPLNLKGKGVLGVLGVLVSPLYTCTELISPRREIFLFARIRVKVIPPNTPNTTLLLFINGLRKGVF